MRKTLMLLIAALTGGLVGSAMLAAPGKASQANQERPGQISQNKVFVENRNKTDAIPVVVQESVQIAGTPTVALAPMTTVFVRPVTQTWAYRTVTVAPGVDPAVALDSAGRDGWETTGLQFPAAGQPGITLLLKRGRN
jgi:hypothetical protein